MADNYSTIQQHQPLRVPSSFDRQGRALIVQLDEIFDDIYRRFGRLRTEDLGGKLKNLILLKDDDGNYVSVSATVEGIEARVADCYGIQSGIDIRPAGIEVSGGKYVKIMAGSDTAVLLDDNGIDMQTAGKAFIHAKDATGSAIIFGTDVDNANFAVDLDGDMYSKTVATDALTLGGFEVPKIVVNASQPDGHNILWCKPTGSVTKQWTKYPDNNKINNSGGTLTYYRDYTISYSASEYLSGSLYYGIKARLYVYDIGGTITPNVTLKARLQNGSSWIDLGDVTKRFYSAGYVELDVDLTSTNTNVMNVSGGSFTVRIETNYSYNSCRMASENMILRAKTTSSASASACDIFYIA